MKEYVYPSFNGLVFVFMGLLFLAFPIYLGLNNTFYGGYGDAEQFIWQAKNLGNLFVHGTLVTDSFFGTPVPYASTPVAVAQGIVYNLTNIIFNNNTLSYNLSVGLFLFLNFIVTLFVLKELKVNRYVRLIFATIFALAPSTIMHSMGHFGVFIVFTIPLLFLMLYKLSYNLRYRYLLITAILLSGSFYIHEYYGVGNLIMFTIWVLIYLKKHFKFKNLRKAVFFIVVLLVTIAPFAKLYLDSYLFQKDNNIQTARTAEEANYYSANPFSYIFPSNQGYLYSKSPFTPYIHNVPGERLNYVGIINLAVVLVFLVLFYKNRYRLNTRFKLFIILSLIVFVIISFGPFITINDQQLILPLNLAFKFEIPPFSSIRSYGRYGIYVFTLLTLINAVLFARILSDKRTQIFNRLKTYRKLVYIIPFLLIPLIILDQYPLNSIPTHRINTPEIVKDLKVAEGKYIFNVPFQWTIGPSFNVTALYFQTINKQPIVNGYSSFENYEWYNKITESSLKCFHIAHYNSSDCSKVTAKQVYEDGVEILVYEKDTDFVTPGYSGTQAETNSRTAILNLFKRVTTPIYEDTKYIIGKVNLKSNT